jgi:hypothetical protein
MSTPTLIYHIEKYIGTEKNGNVVWPGVSFGEHSQSLEDAQKQFEKFLSEAKNTNTFALISQQATLGADGHITGAVKGSAKVVQKTRAAGTAAATATATTPTPAPTPTPTPAPKQ